LEFILSDPYPAELVQRIEKTGKSKANRIEDAVEGKHGDGVPLFLAHPIP
jgi:hypothetical protein